MVENNYLQIKDYDSLDFDTGEVINQLAQNEQKIKKFDNVSFWEIEMSRDTCKKIYDTLCRITDSIFRKLQNSELKLVKMIEQIGNHSFLGFISTFAAKSTKTIKKNNKIHRCYSSCRQINPGYSYTVWLSYRDYYLRSNLCKFTEQGL